MKNMRDFLHMITMRAVFEACEEGNMPGYLGSTIRGIIGHCMRELVCNTPRMRCFKCGERESCLYVSCFSNTKGEGGAINPYVLNVHTRGKTEWKKGDTCTFDLTLFGKAASWAHIYLAALIGMEQKGWGASRLSFRLISVSEPDTKGLIYGGGRIWEQNLVPHLMRIDGRTAQTVLITFDTPLRIVTGGQLFQELTFDVFVRFLYHRLERMSRSYGEEALPWKENELMAAAAHIDVLSQEWRMVEFSRYSMTQKDNRLELPSRMGWVMYEGGLTGFTSFLQAGSYLHIGKGATIGFGHYQVVFDQ